MGKIADGVRKFANKMGSSRLHWPRRKPTPAEKKQLDRWEGEGGAVRDDDAGHG
ncbi:MAG TPA: hypothetical protein VFT01_02475 [Homoserinimonas sp.]|nr:hypothetical protein [Homoserinimonas sp.]